MFTLARDRRSAVTALALSVAGATVALAQAPTVLECNVPADVVSTPRFDPPARGPLTYEWRDATGRTVGSAAGLTVSLPVGQYAYTIAVTAEDGRTATNRVAIVVQDMIRPRVRVRTDVVEAPVLAVGSAPLDAGRAAGFTVADQCDPQPTVTIAPAGPYPPGDTRVLLTATDASGNSASVALVIRVPGLGEPPRRGRAGAVPVPLPPGRSQQGRRGGTDRSQAAPSAPPTQNPPAVPQGPNVSREQPASAAPAEPAFVVPEAPPAATGGLPPGANQPASVSPTTAPAASPRSAPPRRDGRGTDAFGFSLWWLLLPGALLLAGLLRFARWSDDRMPPPLRATIRTLPRKDLGVLRLSFPQGVSQPRFEIRMRPRPSDSAQLEVAGGSIIEERRTHA